jgi:predicted DNA-binding transcriptional regulator AlpA
MPGNCGHPAPLLTTHAIAQVLGIRPRTLQDWRRRCVGPAYIRLSATRVRYSVPVVEAWLQMRTEGPSVESAKGPRWPRVSIARSAFAESR